MTRITPYLIVSVVCLLLGGLSYFVTSSLFFFLGVSMTYFLTAVIVLKPMLRSYQDKERKRHECYRFVNSFIISYSSTGSLEKSYSSSLEDSQKEFRDIQESIISQDVRSRIFYFQRYFSTDLYDMFLSLFVLFEEQGGDLLSVAKGLLDELTRVEEFGDSVRKESVRNLREYILLWAMSMLILGFLRFGLSNFYSFLTKSPVYLTTIGVYFAFFLFSFVFYLSSFFNEKISWMKGRKHEKNP